MPNKKGGVDARRSIDAYLLLLTRTRRLTVVSVIYCIAGVIDDSMLVDAGYGYSYGWALEATIHGHDHPP